MEAKFEAKKPVAQPAPKVTTERAPVVTWSEKFQVFELIRSGKGTIDELVNAGVSDRVAKVAIKTLVKEKKIKQSFVVA